MRVALFVPCYVDQLFPQVGWACVEVLERLGCELEFPPDQTCCGQPFLSAGDTRGAAALAGRFLEVFAEAEHVVAPSASCVATVRRHYRRLLPPSAALEAAERRTTELCEFLQEVLGVERLEGRFPFRVGLHPSCHGLRELGLGSPSEGGGSGRDPARTLLGSLDGIELVEATRPDECCGFGGTFALSEADVACAMGRDRLADHREAGAEVITATDVSCLAHLEGLARRGGLPLRLLHVAEILAEAGRT